MSNQDNEAKQIRRRHQALAILKFLNRSPGFRSNEEVLLDWHRQFGLTSSRDELRGIVSFLETEGLLRTESVEGLLIASMTDDGCDVAAGRKLIDGVQRPTPGCPY